MDRMATPFKFLSVSEFEALNPEEATALTYSRPRQNWNGPRWIPRLADGTSCSDRISRKMQQQQQAPTHRRQEARLGLPGRCRRVSKGATSK